MTSNNTRPPLTLQDFEQRFRDRHLLHGMVEKWAREKPDAIAMVEAGGTRTLSWADFDRITAALARFLLSRGLRKGDCFATLLPLTVEHVLLEYACFKAGLIFVPLDLRLPVAELLRSLALVKAGGFAFWRIPSGVDAAVLDAEVKARCDIKLLVQFDDPGNCYPGAAAFATVLSEALAMGVDPDALPVIHEQDGALVIFTTGSTGSPKAALLSHRGISCQAMCISQALLRGDKDLVTMVNLPASHVGGQTELMMGTFFEGGTALLIPVFDPVRSLKAVQEHRATVIGQIPAMFQFEWRLKEYGSYNLSSLEFAAYGGQKVSEAFLDKMAEMAPFVGSGLGLTETSGFCTYVRRSRENARECAVSLGHAMPVYPMSIREPMQANGYAGDELSDGEIGHICFTGPQTFLGYVNDPASTAAAISTDGYLYTGDLGYKAADGLHLAGRARWVIKPGGYQVFPGDVENYFSTLEQVASCAVVGVEHPVISEAIVAFVEKKPGAQLDSVLLEKHARGLASYMRPRHYVVVDAGEMPLNRVAKADYLRLSERARQEVEMLKAKGQWGSEGQ